MLQTSDSAVVQRVLVGGYDGTEFDDLRFLGWPKEKPIVVGNPIARIVVYSGLAVNGIKVTYNVHNSKDPIKIIGHGAETGTITTITLAADEVITGVFGKAGPNNNYNRSVVSQIGFVITNTSTAATRIAGPFGNGDNTGQGAYFDVSGPLAFSGYHLTNVQEAGISGLSFYSSQAWE